MSDSRAAFKAARDAGLRRRHRQRLDRVIRCRYTDRDGNRCPADSENPGAPLVLCADHTYWAVVLAQWVVLRDPERYARLLNGDQSS